MPMLGWVGLVATVAVAAADGGDNARSAFERFKAEYGKQYGTREEEEHRFEVFQQSLKRVKESGNPTHGVTKFSDLTVEEFREKYHSKVDPRGGAGDQFPQWDGKCTACKRFPGNDKLHNATSYDWTTKGVVTNVKDQKQCGSCWAFAACADMESVWYLGGNELISLSEQELVSCSKANNGCGGGWSWKAFDFVVKRGGIVRNSTYPYTSGHGSTGTCKEGDLKPVAAKISSWFQVSGDAKDEGKMALMLPQIGPFAIGINDKSMQDYRGGIDNPKLCGTSIDVVNHIVTIVGFGEENGVKYWKIKNSWGHNWGERGYYRIVRGENKCALATDAFHSVY